MNEKQPLTIPDYIMNCAVDAADTAAILSRYITRLSDATGYSVSQVAEAISSKLKDGTVLSITDNMQELILDTNPRKSPDGITREATGGTVKASEVVKADNGSIMPPTNPSDEYNVHIPTAKEAYQRSCSGASQRVHNDLKWLLDVLNEAMEYNNLQISTTYDFSAVSLEVLKKLGYFVTRLTKATTVISWNDGGACK